MYLNYFEKLCAYTLQQFFVKRTFNARSEKTYILQTIRFTDVKRALMNIR